MVKPLPAKKCKFNRPTQLLIFPKQKDQIPLKSIVPITKSTTIFSVNVSAFSDTICQAINAFLTTYLLCVDKMKFIKMEDASAI